MDSRNTAISQVKAHYERYPYPDYPFYFQGSWRELSRVELSSWGAKQPVREAWIAGCGVVAPLLFGRRNPEVRILATDLSRTSLRRARWRLFLFGVHNVELREEDILDAGYRQRFDAIDAYGVLHHLPEPELALSVLEAALKSGGVMRLMLYSKAARALFTLKRAEMEALGIDSPEQALPQLKPQGVFELQSLSGVADALFHPLFHEYDRSQVDGLIGRFPQLELLELREESNFVLFLRKK